MAVVRAQLEKTERIFAVVSSVNGANVNVVGSDFEICLGNVSPDFRTSGIRRSNVQHQASVAVEGDFVEVEGVELVLVVTVKKVFRFSFQLWV